MATKTELLKKVNEFEIYDENKNYKNKTVKLGTLKQALYKSEYNDKFGGLDLHNNTEVKCLTNDISSIGHLSLVYESMGKYYFDTQSNVCVKLYHMIFGKEHYPDLMDYENLEYVLYLADYNLQKAKKVYIKHYM